MKNVVNSEKENFIKFLKKVNSEIISKTGVIVTKKFAGRSIDSYLHKQNEQDKIKSSINSNYLKQKESIVDFHSEINELKKQTKLKKQILEQKSGSLYDRVMIEREKEMKQLKEIAKEQKAIKNWSKVKHEKIKEVEKNNIHKLYNTKNECIKAMHDYIGRFNVDQGYLDRIKELKNRMPASSKYNPNYNAIRKHIPCTFIREATKKTVNDTQSSMDKFSVNTDDFYNNVHVMKFENYSPRDLSMFFNKDLMKSSSAFITTLKLDSSVDDIGKENKIKKNIFNKSLYKNISAPDFNKMSSRISKSKKDFHQLPRIYSYSPNYDYFFNSNYSTLTPEYKKKLYLLKKCLCHFHPETRYELVPSLNPPL